jgi:hypothetical protein
LAAAGVLLIQLLTYGCWWDFFPNTSYGPRYLVPSLGPLLLLVSAALDAGRAWRLWAAGALGLAGLAVQIPGALLAIHKLPSVGSALIWKTFPPQVGWKMLLQGGVTGPKDHWWPVESRCDVLAASRPDYAVLGGLALLAPSSSRLSPTCASAEPKGATLPLEIAGEPAVFATSAQGFKGHLSPLGSRFRYVARR